MNSLLKTSLYSIVISGLLLFSFVIYSNMIQRSTTNKIEDFSNVVKNFDDCKASGYPIIQNSPHECQTPSGIIFINLKEAVAATTTETTVIYKKKVATATSSKLK